MKTSLRVTSCLTAGLLAVLTALLPVPVRAAGDLSEPSPLCPPGVYLTSTPHCLPLGPAQYLTAMARKGITFPQTPLPSIQPDTSLSSIPYQYAYVKNDRAPIYRTLQDAVKERGNKINRRIPAGFNYVSYTEETYSGGKAYYLTSWGWMSSKDLRPTEIPTFQGVEFIETPDHAFGWVLNYFSPAGTVETKRSPGYEHDDYTGHTFDHLELIPIYDQELVDGWNWYLVGPDEWIIQTAVAKVTPRDGPPEGFSWKRWIELDLYEQTVAVYQDGQLVFATIVASGDPPHWTYQGVFEIFEKLPVTRMRGRFPEDKSDNYDLDKVPWTMYFDEARAFHGAYWRASLGFPQSHGCVNLSLGDSHWLYNWAELGDKVYVFDPSGKTPSK